ncbi:hypothetical protein ACFFIX_19570 [Metabacillus herbersteinensis]|uniref:Uncharacterized protein n=1 Tax=Metabacillus herbersteinensis TaxID=283816 RepID=A0ABV6GKD1_9BACI
MKKMIHTLLFSSLFVFFLFNTFGSSASALPFIKEGPSSNKKEFGSYMEGVTQDVNNLAPNVSTGISILFAIMFLIGVIKMSYSLVTKTGMILKGSTGVLIGVPIFVICLRLLSIIAFTTTGPGVTLLASDLMLLLIEIGFFAAIGMVLIGLLMKLFHKFLDHPEYARWSKRLFIGAGSLSLLTAIMPVVLRSI